MEQAFHSSSFPDAPEGADCWIIAAERPTSFPTDAPCYALVDQGVERQHIRTGQQHAEAGQLLARLQSRLRSAASVMLREGIESPALAGELAISDQEIQTYQEAQA